MMVLLLLQGKNETFPGARVWSGSNLSGRGCFTNGNNSHFTALHPPIFGAAGSARNSRCCCGCLARSWVPCGRRGISFLTGKSWLATPDIVMEQVGFSVILEAFLCKANGELTGRPALKGDVDELCPLIWLVPSTETSGDKRAMDFPQKVGTKSVSWKCCKSRRQSGYQEIRCSQNNSDK